jgi:hypothetical protein
LDYFQRTLAVWGKQPILSGTYSPIKVERLPAKPKLAEVSVGLFCLVLSRFRWRNSRIMVKAHLDFLIMHFFGTMYFTVQTEERLIGLSTFSKTLIFTF